MNNTDVFNEFLYIPFNMPTSLTQVICRLIAMLSMGEYILELYLRYRNRYTSYYIKAACAIFLSYAFIEILLNFITININKYLGWFIGITILVYISMH